MRRKDKIELIKKILQKRNPMLFQHIEDATSIQKVSEKIRRHIIEVMSDELCEHGLGADSEPTEYGLRIEELIDHLNFDD